MKKIFKTLPLALIVMSIYSCTSDDETVQDVNDNSSVVTTFTCTQENEGTTTKAAMGPEGKTILWESGDAISIFDGDGNNQFTLKAESNGQKSGSFTGKCYKSESYVAVYPYTEGATLSHDRKSVSNIVLPDEQEAVAGGFDPKAALMIAKSETTTLQFKNAVGFIKVTPLFDCTKIILRAADKTQPLAGKGTIKFDGSDPCIDFTGSKELFYSITLSGTITSGKAYYIAVPAVTLVKNWTLTFVTENQNYMRKVTQDITFVRSKALNLGTF
ncbi:MAG: fimbrillin family protein, partial [Prevotella sp.]|nr:fimbrillin family protein [Prevotella sp.]